jgi:regulator of RNase E activity RraA
MSLAQFSTCEISDALIKLSILHGGYIPDINAISPDSNAQICGPAYTVQMVLAASGSKLSSHFVDTAPSGSIIVIDVPPGSVHSAYAHGTFYS